MHCPFTSEISVERKHVLLITVIKKNALFLLFDVRENLHRSPPPPAPPFTHLTVLTQERSVRKKEKLPKRSR